MRKCIGVCDAVDTLTASTLSWRYHTYIKHGDVESASHFLQDLPEMIVLSKCTLVVLVLWLALSSSLSAVLKDKNDSEFNHHDGMNQHISSGKNSEGWQSDLNGMLQHETTFVTSIQNEKIDRRPLSDVLLFRSSNHVQIITPSAKQKTKASPCAGFADRKVHEPLEVGPMPHKENIEITASVADNSPYSDAFRKLNIVISNGPGHKLFRFKRFFQPLGKRLINRRRHNRQKSKKSKRKQKTRHGSSKKPFRFG